MVYSVQPTVISTVYSGPSGVQSLYGRLPSYPGTVTVPLYCLGPYGVLLDCHSLAGFVGPYHSLHSDCDPGPTVPYRSGFHSQGWGPAGPDVTPSAPGLSVGPYGYRGWPGANPPGRPVAGPSAGSSWGQPAGLLAPGNPSASWLAVRGPAGPSASWLAPRPAGSPVAVRLLARGPSARGQRHEVARAVRFLVGPASRGRTIPFRFLGQKVFAVRTYREPAWLVRPGFREAFTPGAVRPPDHPGVGPSDKTFCLLPGRWPVTRLPGSSWLPSRGCPWKPDRTSARGLGGSGRPLPVGPFLVAVRLPVARWPRGRPPGCSLAGCPGPSRGSVARGSRYVGGLVSRGLAGCYAF